MIRWAIIFAGLVWATFSAGLAYANPEIAGVLPGGAVVHFVWIDPGTFYMGSPDADPSANSDEKPQHEVVISEGFYLGKYEVTQEQWESVMGTTPWSYQSHVVENPNHPAVYISREDAQSFIQVLNDTAGGALYRLPTEAEWEYACRGGTTTQWSFGDAESQSGAYAWYYGNAWFGLTVGEQYAHPVGLKLPNPFGLYDIHGNVAEWVQDWYADDYYQYSPTTDPPGPTSGVAYIPRGGSFRGSPHTMRSATRWIGPAHSRNDYFGFRLLMRAVGQINPSTSSIDFGGVQVGQTQDQVLTISNTGNTEVSVTNITTIGLNASEFSLSPINAMIVPSGTLNITVTFVPTSPGGKSAALSIAHNGLVNPTYVGLSGIGQLPPPIASSVPDTISIYDKALQIPFRIGETFSQDIVSVETFLAYDGDLLTATGVDATSTLLTDGWTVETNIVQGVGTSIDTIKIAMATDADVLLGAGTLINVNFQTADIRHPASSALTLTHVLFNAGTPANTTTNGSVTLIGIDGVLTSSPEQIIPRQTIAVTVVDADADLDGIPGTATDQVTVTVINSNGDEETLTLDEDAVTAGTFSQTIATVFGIAENDGDQLIQAQAGDQLTFTYADVLAANGTGPNDRSDQTSVVGGTDGTVDISIASQPGDIVYIKVVDADISTPPLGYMPAATMIDVDVTSTATSPLTVTLSETGAGSGVFVGSLATTSGTESGKMTTAEEDVLTVTYVDDLGVAGEPPVNRTDDNQVLDPWGDADDNDQLQAFDAALTLLEVIDPNTLSGLPERAANVDSDPVGTGINPFDASLILQHRVGIITSFPVQDATSTNHPQPNPASPKSILKERLLALQMHDAYVSVWAEDRTEILSGDLLIEGLIGRVEMGEELSHFLSATRATEEGLRVVFAGAEATSGPGELLRVYGVGAVDAQLTRADLNGGGMIARIGEEERVNSPPQTFALHPNHPNPFNPETTIRYDVSEAGRVRLRIYDATGQVVREWVRDAQMAGSYSVVWDGRNAKGDRVANSVYLYELRVGNSRAIRKMLLMK